MLKSERPQTKDQRRQSQRTWQHANARRLAPTRVHPCTHTRTYPLSPLQHTTQAHTRTHTHTHTRSPPPFPPLRVLPTLSSPLLSQQSWQERIDTYWTQLEERALAEPQHHQNLDKSLWADLLVHQSKHHRNEVCVTICTCARVCMCPPLPVCMWSRTHTRARLAMHDMHMHKCTVHCVERAGAVCTDHMHHPKPKVPNPKPTTLSSYTGHPTPLCTRMQARLRRAE